MPDIVNTGQVANDGTGDPLRTAFGLINQRFQELLGTLSQITWTPDLAIEAAPARQWTVVGGQAYVAAVNHTAGATFAGDLALGRWLAVDVVQLREELQGAGGSAIVGDGSSTVAQSLRAAEAQIADLLAADPAIETLQRITPLLVQTEDFDAKVIGGIGTDLRVYQATPVGLWPWRDAQMQNPLGADGWPAFDAIAQTYPGVINTAATVRAPDDWAGVLYIIPFYGQSLAGGANDNVTDTIFNATSTYPLQSFMPVVGNKPDGRDFDALVPLVETPGTGFDSHFETPLSTMLNTIISELQSKAGAAPKFASFMASRGSRTWAQIGPGNDAWTILVKGILGCVKAARKMGLRPVVPAVMYLQGEQDRSVGLTRDDVAGHRLNMAREIRKAVKLITGQTDDPVVFVSQPNNSTAADGVVPGHMLAPLDLHGVEGMRLLPPHYPYTMPSNVHPDSASYVTMGQLLGRAVLQECFGPGYSPLRVVEARWISSTQIDLIYSVTSGPLVIDTSGTVVTPPVWTDSLYGFQFFDSTGARPIASASVVSDVNLEPNAGRQGRILRIVLASAPTGRSPRLHYATRNDGTGANSGSLTGPRGCIRDSGTLAMWANSQVIAL
jgi:hypothetical protein